jgi:hypothetical protein
VNLFLQWLDSTGQPIGGHAHAGQAFIFQKIDYVDQSYHLSGFKWSQLFTPGPLEFKKSDDEGVEEGFVVLAIEPCTVPSLERRFHRKIEKTSTRVSLEAYASYNFPVRGARLVLQEKVIFEQCEVGRNP